MTHRSRSTPRTFRFRELVGESPEYGCWTGNYRLRTGTSPMQNELVSNGSSEVTLVCPEKQENHEASCTTGRSHRKRTQILLQWLIPEGNIQNPVHANAEACTTIVSSVQSESPKSPAKEYKQCRNVKMRYRARPRRGRQTVEV